MLSVAPYASSILSWEWINGDGELIDVFKLDDDYLRSISRYCSQRVIEAKNDAERDTWQQWVIFTARILAGRRALATPLASESGESQTHGDVKMKCHCGKLYRTRQSYLNRGQGYSCSKSCAAKRRANALPKATVAELFKHKDQKDV